MGKGGRIVEGLESEREVGSEKLEVMSWKVSSAANGREVD